jgi:hypothetical protein
MDSELRAWIVAERAKHTDRSSGYGGQHAGVSHLPQISPSVLKELERLVERDRQAEAQETDRLASLQASIREKLEAAWDAGLNKGASNLMAIPHARAACIDRLLAEPERPHARLFTLRELLEAVQVAIDRTVQNIREGRIEPMN